MKTENDLKISAEDFKLIKQFYPEFSRKQGIKSNDFIIGWSELMPVVEKITELGFNTTWNYNCETQTRYFSIYDLPYRNTAKGMQFYAEGDNCMYNAVVKFIRWYTSKNS